MLDAEARQGLRHELPGAAIAVAKQHHVIAGLDERQHRGGDRGHAARKRDARLRQLQSGHAPLQLAHGGVAVAAVLFARRIRVFTAHVAFELGRVGERERGGGFDAQRERVVWAPGRHAGVNAIGGTGDGLLVDAHLSLLSPSSARADRGRAR